MPVQYAVYTKRPEFYLPNICIQGRTMGLYCHLLSSIVFKLSDYILVLSLRFLVWYSCCTHLYNPERASVCYLLFFHVEIWNLLQVFCMVNLLAAMCCLVLFLFIMSAFSLALCTEYVDTNRYFQNYTRFLFNHSVTKLIQKLLLL